METAEVGRQLIAVDGSLTGIGSASLRLFLNILNNEGLRALVRVKRQRRKDVNVTACEG